MSKRKLHDALSLFDTTLSSAEWAWRIVVLIAIGGSGTAGGFIARATPFLKTLGPLYWLAVGLVTSLVTALILYLVKAANHKQSLTDLNASLAAPRNTINPLAHNFSDVIIPVEDLRLPTQQLHENKLFKRCKFVGPATLAIQGGTYVNSRFNECGDIIALPDGVYLTGVTALRNCTVEECEFVQVTILTDQNTAKGFAQIPGARVKGVA